MSFTHPHKNIQASFIGNGMRVADFGSGIGHHLLPIARQVGESGIIYAVEIQKDLLARLDTEAKREKLKNVHPILGNIEKDGGSTLKDKSVDRVLIINTLFQLEEKAGAFKEAHRILKSTGKLYISDWEGSFNHMGPHPEQVVKKYEALRLAESAGFVLDKEVKTGDHHYGLLFRLQ